MTPEDDRPYVELLLDEPTGLPPRGGEEGWGTPAPEPVTSARRLGRWWAAVVAAVLVMVAITTTQAGWAPDDTPAPYVDVAGAVRPMPAPVDDLWHMPVTDRLWLADGAVITVERAGVVARETGTGAVRWRVPLPEGATTAGVSCPLESGRDGSTVVLCSMPRGPDTPTSFAERGIDVIDTADGTVVRELPVPAFLYGAGSVDGDLVLAQWIDDRLTVERQDVNDGRELWRAELAGVFPAGGLSVLGNADVVVLQGATTVALTAEGGRELGRWQAEGGPSGLTRAQVVLAPSGFGVWTSRASGRWYGPDGARGPRLAGVPADPAVRDGSDPDVVLVTSADRRQLRAVDLRTGEELWARPHPGRVLLRLGGRLVVQGTDSLNALDVTTGEDLWAADLAMTEVLPSPPVTDGRHVAVLGRARDGDPVLTAYLVGSGLRQWRTRLPTGFRYLQVLDRSLFAVVRPPDGTGGERLVALG